MKEPRSLGCVVRVYRRTGFTEWVVGTTNPKVAKAAALEEAGLPPDYRGRVRIQRLPTEEEMKSYKATPSNAHQKT